MHNLSREASIALALVMKYGNVKTSRSLGLAVPSAFFYAYSVSLQMYVLRLDVIVGFIGIVFVGFEGILSVVTALSFYRAFRG